MKKTENLLRETKMDNNLINNINQDDLLEEYEYLKKIFLEANNKDLILNNNKAA